MKIAFLNIHSGLVERGSEIFVHELATQLADIHDVTVFQLGSVQNSRYEIKLIRGVKKHFHQGFLSFNSPKILNILNIFLYDFWVLIFTIKSLPYLWNEGYDWIVPINGRSQVIICRLIRFFRGGKILISGHAGIGLEDRINLTLGKPDIFVALSRKAFEWAEKISKGIKIKYIPNGVNIKKFNNEKKDLNIEIKRPRIICVSALVQYKRIDLLIKAVQMIPNFSLLVIGDGPLRLEIMSNGKKTLGENFLLITKIKHENIASYYHNCDVFSLPSEDTEAFGMVYLEALSCNLPIVAPDDQNRRDIIGSAGIYCNVENSEEYSKSLKLAIDMDFRNKPLIQAKKFDWSVIAKKYYEIFDNK